MHTTKPQKKERAIFYSENFMRKIDLHSFFTIQTALVAEWVPGISQKIGWRQVEHGFSSFFAKFLPAKNEKKACIDRLAYISFLHGVECTHKIQ